MTDADKRDLRHQTSEALADFTVTGSMFQGSRYNTSPRSLVRGSKFWRVLALLPLQAGPIRIQLGSLWRHKPSEL